MSPSIAAPQPHAAAPAASTALVRRPVSGDVPPAPQTPPGPPAGYYAAAQGKEGAALLTALHGIISKGHIDNGYAQARDGLFSLVADPNRNNTVADIYTGDERHPVTERKSAYDHGLNAEHTWPQSLGARGIAQSDLHQLMAADIETNGARGSLPYGTVANVDWSRGEGVSMSKRGTDAAGDHVFEPRDAVKGDIARALMYFYTRYNEDRPADYSLVNFRKELPTLVQWAHDDPVDAQERQRNDDVFALQHNRNPYIDHPEWIDTAGFGSLRVGN